MDSAAAARLSSASSSSADVDPDARRIAARVRTNTTRTRPRGSRVRRDDRPPRRRPTTSTMPRGGDRTGTAWRRTTRARRGINPAWSARHAAGCDASVCESSSSASRESIVSANPRVTIESSRVVAATCRRHDARRSATSSSFTAAASESARIPSIRADSRIRGFARRRVPPRAIRHRRTFLDVGVVGVVAVVGKSAAAPPPSSSSAAAGRMDAGTFPSASAAGGAASRRRDREAREPPRSATPRVRTRPSRTSRGFSRWRDWSARPRAGRERRPIFGGDVTTRRRRTFVGGALARTLAQRRRRRRRRPPRARAPRRRRRGAR